MFLANRKSACYVKTSLVVKINDRVLSGCLEGISIQRSSLHLRLEVWGPGNLHPLFRTRFVAGYDNDKQKKRGSGFLGSFSLGKKTLI